jgi:hypothetical protein
LQITRNINGIDDLGTGGYLANNQMKHITNFSPSDPYAYNPGWNDSNEYHFEWNGYGTEGKQNAYYMAIPSYSQKDGMPDHFYYKLAHKSGSFYFQKDASGTAYSIVPVPYEDIKIVYIGDGVFTITDTDGTCYYYGASASNLEDLHKRGAEFSGSVGPGAPLPNQSTWKCMKIIAPNKTDSITFEYSMRATKQIRTYQDRIEYHHTFSTNISPSYIVYPSNTHLSTYEYQCLIDDDPFHTLSSPKYFVYSGGGLAKFYHPYVNNTNQVICNEYNMPQQTSTVNITKIDGLNLSKIKYRGGEITFDGTVILNAFSIKERNVIKPVTLFQSYKEAQNQTAAASVNGTNYFGTNYLDSLRIGEETYYFGYYRDYTIEGFPEKYCFGNHLKGHDAWGYFNQTTKDMTSNLYYNTVGPFPLLMPKIEKQIKKRNTNQFYPLILGGNSELAEEPNEEAMKLGVLTRIIYPTGGFVNFDYEANRYAEFYCLEDFYYMYTNRLAGGLRIKSITHYDEGAKV